MRCHITNILVIFGARQASHRHFPHSRQIIESDWSIRIAEFIGNVDSNVEPVGRGKGDSNVLIKLNRLLFDWWRSCCSDIEDDIEELWFGHIR